MKLINNQLYIDLTSQVDYEGLKSIEKDIVLGIVKSRENIREAGAAKRNFWPTAKQLSSCSLLDLGWTSEITKIDNPYYEYYKKLDFNMDKCKMFIKYIEPTIQMGTCLELRGHPPKMFQLKDSAKHCYDTPSMDHFSELKKWIYEQTIFKEIGRVIFFFNSPYDQHAMHKDHYFGNPEQFILINLQPNRKEFFIINRHDGSETVIPSNVIVFDPRNYHGTRGLEYYSWTLRIDGKFNEEWAKSIGIWEHFKPADVQGPR
jgi:hypothetical protein